MGVENLGTRGASKAPPPPCAWASRLCPAPSAARRHPSGPGLRGQGSARWHLRWQQGWGPGPPHPRLRSLHLHTQSGPLAGTCWGEGQEGPPSRGERLNGTHFTHVAAQARGLPPGAPRGGQKRAGVSGSWLWRKSGCKAGWGQRDEKGGCGGWDAASASLGPEGTGFYVAG